MLAHRTYENDRTEFVISIENIMPSRRSPGEYFYVYWSVSIKHLKDHVCETSFIIKFTDNLLNEYGIKAKKDAKTNEIIPAKRIAEVLINHLVVQVSGEEPDTEFKFFFADKVNGTGPFDSSIVCNRLRGATAT